MAHSLETRIKALTYYEKCKNLDLVTEAFGISRRSLFLWKKKLKETGDLSVAKRQNRPRKIDREELFQYLKDNPDKFLREIAEEFNCGVTAIRKILIQHKISYKKRQHLQRARKSQAIH